MYVDDSKIIDMLSSFAVDIVIDINHTGFLSCAVLSLGDLWLGMGGYARHWED